MPKINELPAATALTATDVLAMDNTSGTATKKVTGQQIKEFATADVNADVADLKSAVTNLENDNFFNFGLFAQSTTKTNNDVTYTRVSEKRWTAVGTSSATSRYWIFDEETFVHLKAGKKYRVEFNSSDSNIMLATHKYVGSTNTAVPIVNGILTIPSDATGFMFRIDTASGKTVNATIDFAIYNIPDGIEAVKADYHALFAETPMANIILPYLTTKNETYKGITYAWTGNTCHVTGRATATSFTDVVDMASGFPAGMKPGGTYWAHYYGKYISLRVYKYVNGTLNVSAVFATTTGGQFTIPSDATGILIRLYITNTTVTLNDYVSVSITRTDNPEQLVFSHKIAFFGDSIVLGRDGDGSSTDVTQFTLANTISERLSVVCDNLGVGGMGYIAQGSDNNNAYAKIAATDLTEYDTVIMCFGVNDGFDPIGTYDSTDESTCLGQFNKIITYVGTNYPSMRIIVVAPFNGRNVGTFPKYWYGNVPSTAYSRGTLSDTLRQACEYYNIPYIEQKDGPVNGYSIATLIGTDGVHPGDAGYKAIGGWLSGEIARLIG